VNGLRVSPAVGEFAIGEAERLRAVNAELAAVLQSAAVLRPKLLTQYGAVPECVLDFCNRARAALAKARA